MLYFYCQERAQERHLMHLKVHLVEAGGCPIIGACFNTNNKKSNETFIAKLFNYLIGYSGPLDDKLDLKLLLYCYVLRLCHKMTNVNYTYPLSPEIISDCSRVMI